MDEQRDSVRVIIWEHAVRHSIVPLKAIHQQCLFSSCLSLILLWEWICSAVGGKHLSHKAFASLETTVSAIPAWEEATTSFLSLSNFTARAHKILSAWLSVLTSVVMQVRVPRMSLCFPYLKKLQVKDFSSQLSFVTIFIYFALGMRTGCTLLLL